MGQEFHLTACLYVGSSAEETASKLKAELVNRMPLKATLCIEVKECESKKRCKTMFITLTVKCINRKVSHIYPATIVVWYPFCSETFLKHHTRLLDFLSFQPLTFNLCALLNTT